MEYMKRNVTFYLLMCLLAACTGRADREAQADYVFDADVAVTLPQSGLMEARTVVPLAFSDSTLVSPASSLVMDEEHFYIYLQGGAYPVLAFNKSGTFSFQMGGIGNGPDEYVAVGDVACNRKKGQVDVMTNNAVLGYSLQSGRLVERLALPFPAFSFALDGVGNYWFYTGGNFGEEHYKVARTDSLLQHSCGFLPSGGNLLPMVEPNWGKCSYLTYHESLSHDLHLVEEGELQLAHKVSFPGYDLPEDLFDQTDPMKTMDILKQTDYAVIKTYAENDRYLFVYVLLMKAAREKGLPSVPDMYYWLVDKPGKKEKIIKLDAGVGADSYLFNPQLLSEDNKLYCLGHLLESVGNAEQFSEDNVNPVVAVIDLDKLF